MNEIEYGLNTVGNFRLLNFATGAYIRKCRLCGKEFIGDKRAVMCLACALTIVNREKCGGEMNKEQFKLHMEMMERIGCQLINIETEIQEIAKKYQVDELGKTNVDVPCPQCGGSPARKGFCTNPQCKNYAT